MSGGGVTLLDSLVVELHQQAVDHLGVAQVLSGHEDHSVACAVCDDLGLVAVEVLQRHPAAKLAVAGRLGEELSEPRICIRNREVADLDLAERLRVRVAQDRVDTDFRKDLGELGSLFLSADWCRQTVRPLPTAADGLQRVVAEGVSVGAAGRGGRDVAGLNRQDGRVSRCGRRRRTGGAQRGDVCHASCTTDDGDCHHDREDREGHRAKPSCREQQHDDGDQDEHPEEEAHPPPDVNELTNEEVAEDSGGQ